MSLKDNLRKSKENNINRLEAVDEKIRKIKESGGHVGKLKELIMRMSIPARVIAGVLIVCIVAGGVYTARYFTSKNSSTDGNKQGMQMGNMQTDTNTITASGTTTVGMIAETFDVENLDTDLEVEEVYVENGDSVAAGDKILKISEDSLEKARTELEDAASEAEYAYRLGVISSNEELITAKSTLDSASVNKTYAQNDYDSSVQDAKEKVEDLQSQVDDASDLVDEYTKADTENYYYTYYDVAALQKIASDNFTLLMKLYEDWDIADTEDSDSSSTSSSSSSSSGTTSSSKISNSTSSVYDAFSDEVDEEEEEYETAKENYEDDTKTAKAGLSKAKANLTKLQAQLTTAQTEYNTAKAQAQSDYNETISDADTAEETYNTTVDRINDNLEVLSNAMDDANDNLESFEEAVNDGYMYASTDGTIMMVGVEEGDTLSSDSMVVAYTDDTSISVSATVDQSYISQLTIGDAASVVISDYGTFEGTITSINPVTQSSSKSSVTYTVTVGLTGDVSELSQNLSATVTFTPSSSTDAASTSGSSVMIADSSVAASSASDSDVSSNGDSEE